nr:integrase [Rickettsiella massiliensis]
MPGRDIVGKVINEPVQAFNTFLDRFEFELMPERKLAVLTIKEHKKKLVHIRKELGDKLIDELSIKEVSEFLDKFPSVSSNRYRSLLIVIFKYAIVKGLCKENPVEKTLPKMEEKKRQRLELEGFLDIYNYHEAEPWFKNAMDLGLQTLQRREDLVNLKFSDIKERYLYVIQHKTEKHGDSAYLKIKITPILQNVLSRCRDCFLSPFILHRKPDKHSKQNYKAESKQHFTQITPDYLTRTFSSIRDKLPRFKSIPMAKRPTFHEIR